MNASGPDSSAAVLSKKSSFGRDRRLLKHSDFQRVYKQGRRHFGTHLTVFYLKRDDRSGSRIGFAVGKVLGGAVVRNRMKRRMRELVRFNFPGSLAADIVIHPRKSALSVEFAVLNQEIARAFQAVAKAVVGAPLPHKSKQ